MTIIFQSHFQRNDDGIAGRSVHVRDPISDRRCRERGGDRDHVIRVSTGVLRTATDVRLQGTYDIETLLRR